MSRIDPRTVGLLTYQAVSLADTPIFSTSNSRGCWWGPQSEWFLGSTAQTKPTCLSDARIIPPWQWPDMEGNCDDLTEDIQSLAWTTSLWSSCNTTQVRKRISEMQVQSVTYVNMVSTATVHTTANRCRETKTVSTGLGGLKPTV